MTIPLTDLRAQYDSIKAEVDSAIRRVVQGGQFILGAEVKAFEDEIAGYCGTGHAVGVASGTDALQLALLASGIGPGDAVITTPFTFIATAEAIVRCGAIPVFVDIDPKSHNLDPRKLEEFLSQKSTGSPLVRGEGNAVRVKAILPVHLYGQPADMEHILRIAADHDLIVIEDCAQALGAEYRGEKVGSLGIAGCLSFFPAKNLGAYGDGGMVVTGDAGIADTVRMLRAHGSRAAYRHVMHGFNSRLDALQAAVLRVKLKHLDTWNELRRRKAASYAALLGRIGGIQPPHFQDDCKSSCNYYTVRLSGPRLDRDQFRRHLESRGIATAVYYPLSLHLQEVYRHLGHKTGDFPESERAQEEVLSLPMYPELSEEQIEEVAGEINEFAKGD